MGTRNNHNNANHRGREIAPVQLERQMKKETFMSNNISKELGKCSECESAVKTSTKSVDLISELHGIKNGRWKNEVEAVRAGQKEKHLLPQICVYGVYVRSRKDENLRSRSGFAVLDYDKKDNPKVDFSVLKTNLSRLPFILAVFTSPSGNGLKAIVRVPEKLSIDEQVALCANVLKPLGGTMDMGLEAFKHAFVSYDPEMYLNEAPLSEIPAIDDFETMELETLNLIFHKVLSPLYCYGRNYYDAETRAERSVDQIRRKLKEAGIPKSMMDRVLVFIDSEKSVNDIKSAYSAHEAGYYKEQRMIVETSPMLLYPEKGNGVFDYVKNEIDYLFDDPAEPMQVHVFLTILKNARKNLRKSVEANSGKGNPPEGKTPAVCIMGERSLGKSKFMDIIFVPLLGGRSTDGKKILAQNARFTGELEKVEVLVVDDKSEDSITIPRQTFMDKIKEIGFSSEVSGETKFKNETKLSGCCWFITQLFNPDRINTTPIYEPDKVVFLCAGAYSNIFEGFSESDFSEYNGKIKNQLEAFAYWLDNEYEPPKDILPTNRMEQRIGVKAYCHPACAKQLDNADEELILLELIDEAFRTNSFGLKYEKSAKASEIACVIKDSSKAEVFARRLKKLASRFPNRIEQIYSGEGTNRQSRGWIIHAPSGVPDTTKQA